MLIVAALTCAGCSGAVDVRTPVAGPVATKQCQRLIAVLPQRVAGQAVRDVHPADALAMAWGDPPVVLRCGVAKPAALRPDSACFVVNGVGWFARQNGRPVSGTEPVTAEIVFTTVGRSPYVEVAVPPDYQPAANALVDVAEAVSSATTERRPCV